jgi:hypothetical protein
MRVYQAWGLLRDDEPLIANSIRMIPSDGG